MSKKFKVIYLDTLLPMTNYETDILDQAGAEVLSIPAASPEEIVKAAKDADAVMTIAAKITREVVAGLENCKVIGRYGIGLDNIDLEAATEKGIVVTNVPVYCQDEVAEIALVLMLACQRRLMIGDRMTRAGRWKQAVGAVDGARSSRRKTLGLVGFGSIARKLVPLVKPLGIKVIASDPYINLDFCKELDVEPVSFEELLRRSDFVSIHTPLLPSTRHMFGAEQFRMMKKEAVLVNTGRGAVVDQKALYEALRDGEIAVAGLDELEFEPPADDDPIFALDNVITSGHIAAATTEALINLRESVAQGVADVLSGKWPKVLGNPEVKGKVKLAD